MDHEPRMSLAITGHQPAIPPLPWATNYILQSVTNLASTNWLAVTNGVPVIGITVPYNLPTNCYRLISE